MNEMQVFKYEDNEVRTVEQGGEVWWVLADVCRVLEVKRTESTARKLDPDEKGAHLVSTPGGDQRMTIISESGLYKVILRSDKPQAKKFTRWVTHEVLPTIRRTGGYSQPGAQTFTMEQMTKFAAAVASQVAMQIVPIIAATVKQVYQEAVQGTSTSTAPSQGSDFRPFRSGTANCLKLETFPEEIVDEVDRMLALMREQQALNFSQIARFCTMNGCTISSPSVKRYFDRHFSEG